MQSVAVGGGDAGVMRHGEEGRVRHRRAREESDEDGGSVRREEMMKMHCGMKLTTSL